MGRSRATSAAAALLRRATSVTSEAAASFETIPLFSLSQRTGPASKLFSTAATRTVGGASPMVGAAAAASLRSDAFYTASFSPARFVTTESLQPSDVFQPRHNCATDADIESMLKHTKFESLDDLITATVPRDIVRTDGMDIGAAYNEGMTESNFLAYFKEMAEMNTAHEKKNFIGMGYHGTHLPPVVQRNVLENPGWYTQYTPYQAEISQGRLEMLLNFQTMVADLTGMELSNASLLDEATAAAEAMTMCSAIARGKKTKFLVSEKCHPQTIAVCQTRASGLGLQVVVSSEDAFDYSGNDVCGVLVQYPDTTGAVSCYKELSEAAHAAKVKVCVATDLLSLTMLTPPGEWGADIVVGCAQRFGVPMGYGGPHAAFLATSSEYKRLLPGRIIGMSEDADGNPALRMAMQTREQHIRRDKATSNICTAQALLANISACFGVYHGPEGLKTMAARINGLAHIFAEGASQLGAKAPTTPFFDTVTLEVADAAAISATALEHGVNLRVIDATHISCAFDETHTPADVDALFAILNGGSAPAFTCESLASSVDAGVGAFARSSSFMTHPVFNTFHDEHSMLRYLKKLENKDLSLVHSMIALGSCTMKLNSSTEMMPVTWPELANVHPFVPVDQVKGYNKMFEDLSAQLCSITGFDAMSLQPNSGASGEYAGLMGIRAYHHARGDAHRNICIIPTSAHGTNPASAVMCGMKIVPVPTTPEGSIDMGAFTAAVEKHRDNLAAFMITYPSTYGVFDEGIKGVCEMIHEAGGQVYMDGANMNAQVGLTSPGHIGADVCHLNLHKTFCIPHGGGGPGMGPIGIKAHLAPYMPTHPVIPTGSFPPVEGGDKESFGAMAAAPYGSSLILPISYAYISMMGSEGLKKASELAILNANYMMGRLEGHYDVLFKGANGTCAHEFIIDLRPFKDSHGIEAEDIAKRLMDYGFHSPTMSWPVAGTLMIEPTESEPIAELDRFCNAMIAIRGEIAEIESGAVDAESSALKGAPHTQAAVTAEEWTKPYSREKAAFPAAWVRDGKFWPTISRIDNVLGDRVLRPRLEEAKEATA